MKVTLVRAAAALLAPVPVLLALGVQEPESFPGDATLDAAIRADELRGHVQALASDAMRGRDMGTPESLLAADYVAERLAAAGVQPGAKDGSYMQVVPLASVRYASVPELRIETKDGEELTLFNGEAFSFPSSSPPPDARRLRCVVVADEDDVPAEADPDVALVMATSAMRSRRWLDAAGHPGGAGFGLVLIPKRSAPKERAVPRKSSPRPLPSGGRALQISLRGDWSARFADGDVTSVEFVSHAEVEEARDVNVVGVIPGVKGERAKEIVLLSAHRDHVGVREDLERSDPEADAILNGADDDASGCAAILEIAESLAQGDRPARTTVVLFVTGEERGLIGSRYWAENPTHPIEDVVCGLNFEMLGRPDELVGGPGKVWLTGDERSTLGPGLRERGMEILGDPRPAMNFFVRSDNVSFAKVGIVAQTLSTYGEHTDYHKVTDEWETLDYDHMEAAVGQCLEAVLSLVHGDWKPEWNEGEPKF